MHAWLNQLPKPLQILGTVNAYCALLAERAGASALYVSGAGVANASYGIPDLGLTTLEDVCVDVRRIRGVTELPLLVDADTGWGNPKNAIRKLEAAGASACHIEDQVEQKRCGHRPNKVLVRTEEMCSRIQQACEGRESNEFSIMARTDSVAVEGIEAAVERSNHYVSAGADLIFAEALYSLEDYRLFTESVSVPVLANITEFGKTPLFTLEELSAVGVKMVLYPLSAFRAMSLAAESVYQTVLEEGTQRGITGSMQTRDQLYEVLNYHAAENILDANLAQSNPLKTNPNSK